MGHSHVPGGRAREVRAPDSPGPGLCLQHLGPGRHSESRGAGGPSRTSSLSHSIGPGGPGGAARLEASPGEAGPSQRDEVQLRGGLGRPLHPAAAPSSGDPDCRVELDVLGGLLAGREAQREGLGHGVS